MSCTDAVAEANHREYGDEDEDGHDKEGERGRIEGEYAGNAQLLFARAAFIRCKANDIKQRQ